MKNINGDDQLVVYLKPWQYCKTAGIARFHLSKLIDENKIDSAIFNKELYIPIDLGYVARSVFGINPELFKEEMRINRPQTLLPAGGLLFRPLSFTEWEARNARNQK